MSVNPNLRHVVGRIDAGSLGIEAGELALVVVDELDGLGLEVAEGARLRERRHLVGLITLRRLVKTLTVRCQNLDSALSKPLQGIVKTLTFPWQILYSALSKIYSALSKPLQCIDKTFTVHCQSLDSALSKPLQCIFKTLIFHCQNLDNLDSALLKP